MLVQAQALVVGQLAAVFAILLSWIPQAKFSVKHGLLLCTSSVLTAAIASFVLSVLPSLLTVVVVVVVMISRSSSSSSSSRRCRRRRRPRA